MPEDENEGPTRFDIDENEDLGDGEGTENEDVSNWRQDEELEPEEDNGEGIVSDTGDDEQEGDGGLSPTTAQEGEQPSVSPSLPPVALQEVYTAAQIEDMRAQGITDAQIFYMAQGAIQAAQRMEGSMLQSASLYQQTMQQAPEYERVIGPRVRQHLAGTVNQQVRHTQEGINQAMAIVLLEEANADGTPEGFVKALQRHAQLANPKMRPIAQPAPKGPTQRPEQRIPAPSVSGARSSAGGRPQSAATRASRLLGTSVRNAEDIFDER